MESSSMNNTVGKDDDLLVDTAEAEALKKRISSHPLYGLLVQTHIDCLKVGTIGDVDRIPRVRPNLSCQFPNPSSLSQPELDSFMEAYCFALSKLKEAMEEPQQETVAFINSMHLQLKELTRTHSKSTAEHSTSTTSSGERID
ncbi:homeobox protein knotted-1-like 12 [Populus alba]|uniref:homeobox protein knotted-1-like 12 n=1 Tax=Populus alba TaxID=43335 RepID=UPI00158AF906|nr:homeobox protein knotted-1-like 1 [Populus alba]